MKDADNNVFYTDSSNIIGSNGTGTVYVEVPSGAVNIAAEVVYQGVAGERDTADITVDTVAPSLASPFGGQ